MGGVQLNVNPGSGLASDSTVVLAHVTTLEKSGLSQISGGLNVIGSGGLNSRLLDNFKASNLGIGNAGNGLIRR